MATGVHLAIDLAAESGRVIAGVWDAKAIRLDAGPSGPQGVHDVTHAWKRSLS